MRISPWLYVGSIFLSTTACSTAPRSGDHARDVVKPATSASPISKTIPETNASSLPVAPKSPPKEADSEDEMASSDAYHREMCPKEIPVWPTHNEHVYIGTIAGQGVAVRFQCDTTPCQGYYFYQRIGERIELSPEGKKGTTFVETTHKTWTGRLEFPVTPIGAKILAGTWTTPDKKRSETISLNLVPREGTPRIFSRSLIERAVHDPQCVDEVKSFEVAGLVDPAVEQGVNRLVDPELHGVLTQADKDEDCSGNECTVGKNGHTIMCAPRAVPEHYQMTTEFAIKYVDSSILSIRMAQGGNAGRAHPMDGVTSFNIDLRTGELVGIAAWLLPEAKKVDWHVYDAEIPDHVTLTVEGPSREFHPNVRWNFDMLEKPNADGLSCTLSGYVSAYVTKDGIELIPQAGYVGHNLQHHPVTVSWAQLSKWIRLDGPLGHFVAPRSP